MNLLSPAARVRDSLILLLAALGGCQAPPARVTAAGAAPAPPVVRLCGHDVAPDEKSIKDEVSCHVAPGQPVEEACARMEALGFTCRYSGFSRKKPVEYHPTRTLRELIDGRDPVRDKHFHSLSCTVTLNQVGCWGRRFFPVTVQLPYDEGGHITEVEVHPLSPQLHFLKKA